MRTPLYLPFQSNHHVLSTVETQRCLVTPAPEVPKNDHNDTCIAITAALYGIRKCLDIVHTPYPSQIFAGVYMLGPVDGSGKERAGTQRIADNCTVRVLVEKRWHTQMR